MGGGEDDVQFVFVQLNCLLIARCRKEEEAGGHLAILTHSR